MPPTGLSLLERMGIGTTIPVGPPGCAGSRPQAVSALWGSVHEGDMDERQHNVFRTVVTLLILIVLLCAYIGVTTALGK